MRVSRREDGVIRADRLLTRFKQCHAALEDTPKHPIIRCMRGNIDSRTLMLIPPCTPEEYAAQIPFSAKIGQGVHRMLDTIGFYTERDCLAVSCSIGGFKANKNNTDVIKSFLHDVVDANYFDRFIVVGDDTFKYLFAHGKKAGMQTLGGATLYVPQTGQKPLFVFPSPDALYPEFLQDENDWKLRRMQEKTQAAFQRYLIKFLGFLEETK